jgi:hypothetical protein
MAEADLRFLRALQKLDDERTRRIRAESAAQALKLQNEALRRKLRTLTHDGAIRVNSASRESAN